MLDPVLERRIPVLVFLAIISVISVLDWQHDFGAWMMRPATVVDAWEDLRAGDYSRETLKALATLTTAEFLHGDVGHLAGNLLFLWIFGVVITELCGWRWLVAVFLITGVGASVGQIFLDVGSRVAVLGASGGLMGMEGFYFGLAFQRPRPDAEVWPIARPVSSSDLAAVGVVGILLDFMGILGPGQGIAYGAHIGGFVTGLLISLFADRLIRV